MLAQYVTEVQNLLNDQQGQFFTIPTISNYVNRARRRVASASGCLRVLPEGAKTHPGQEIYPFSDWISLVQATKPGVASILYCRSISVSIGPNGWKPMWRQVPFTDFQARFRIWNNTFIGTISEPGWWATFGVGPDTKIYLCPIPSQENPIDVDLTCIPAALLTDNDPEPLPYPWTDAVSYWAAVLCLLQQQRAQDAQAMAQLFNNDMPMCAAVVCPQLIINPYGASLRSA